MNKTLAVLVAVFAALAALLHLAREFRIEPQELGVGDYDITPVSAPVATGLILKVLSSILTNDWISPLPCRLLLNDNGFHRVRQLGAQVSGPAVQWPIVRLDEQARTLQEKAAALAKAPLPAAGVGDGFRGVLDYHELYRSKASTPTQEVKRALERAKSLGGRLKCFVDILEASAVEEAEQSTRRWAAGKQLGVLDGVPFACKDEVAIKGTVLGEGLVRGGREAQTEDDLVVARLRRAGAVLIGKTVMTLFGASPLGWNVGFQGPFNPYNTSHYTGGSSAGSGVAVAAGIVPFAIGLDGGGSIRLPAALSGVFGIAATFSRIPFDGAAAEAMSVVRIGPLAADAASLALVYSLLAQPEPRHHYSEVYGGVGPPPPHLADFNNIASLEGLRMGVFTPHFEDASPAIVTACRKAVQSLQALGATVVEVRIPHMKVLSLAHATIIGSEMAAIHDLDWSMHRESMQDDTRIEFGLFREFPAKNLVSANRLRGWAMRWMRDNVWSKADVYVSPATGVIAPTLSLATQASGESDVAKVMQIMKFIFLCNLLGNPGMSVPIAYDADTSLPIALHLMASHWQEATLLRLANVLQARVQRKRPGIFAAP